MGKQLNPGDWVIYRKSKQGRAPGPRAQHVVATRKGDDYAYTVDKYWVVDDVLPDGTVLLKTRRGKVHRMPITDPALRKAGFITRIMWRNRFQEICRDRPGGEATAMSA